MSTMAKERRNIRDALSKFISSENGQRFFNVAYSIGAAIVICGVLFKVIALPGANILLTVGLATEVVMFLLTAFDQPATYYSRENLPDKTNAVSKQTVVENTIDVNLQKQAEELAEELKVSIQNLRRLNNACSAVLHALETASNYENENTKGC